MKRISQPLYSCSESGFTEPGHSPVKAEIIELGSLPFEGEGEARGPTGDIIDRNSPHMVEKKTNSICTLKWQLGRLRGTKLENRNSQLSISKTDSRNRHNWSGIRADRRKLGTPNSQYLDIKIYEVVSMDRKFEHPT